jgi:hypothetical protein
MQDRINCQEGIADPPFSQGMGYRGCGFTGAELVIPDVRVGDILRAGRGMGIEGDDIEY